MEELFQIYVDRLRGDHVESIVGPFAPSFLGVDEPELKFPSPVEIKGEAYLSEDYLVLHFNASVLAKMPCSVCNEMIETTVQLENYYHTEPLAEIEGAIFNFREVLREALLLELPHYLECNQGKCPERSSITPFLRSKPNRDTHFPFSDL